MVLESIIGYAESSGINLFVIIPVVIWSITWTGIALWRAAQRKHLVWFIILLVTNTLGILEILYYFIFSNMRKNKRKINNAN